MEQHPNLVDYGTLKKIKSTFSKGEYAYRKKVGGFFSFLKTENVPRISIVFTVAFFTLLVLFLVLRYNSHKQRDVKTKSLEKFISSANKFIEK